MQELIYPRQYADEHFVNTQLAFIAYNTLKMHGRHGAPRRAMQINPNG